MYTRRELISVDSVYRIENWISDLVTSVSLLSSVSLSVFVKFYINPVRFLPSVFSPRVFSVHCVGPHDRSSGQHHPLFLSLTSLGSSSDLQTLTPLYSFPSKDILTSCPRSSSPSVRPQFRLEYLETYLHQVC